MASKPAAGAPRPMSCGRLEHCHAHDGGGGVSVTPITKEAQRAELHKTIWRIANDLRGSVDGWDFKSYVLGMLFYRFISENLTAYLNRLERNAGVEGFDFALL